MDSFFRKYKTVILAALLILGFGFENRAASTNELLVANDGLDSPACGFSDVPCRSISQAIINAYTNDTIIVGPGRYGDLNGNGVFGETGEETAPSDCTCMIKIDKRLKIVSTDGPLATVLDAGGAVVRGIAVLADGVTFGGKGNSRTLIGQGFTVTGTGSGAAGLSINADHVQVIGNIATNNGNDGFAVFGDQTTVAGNVAIGNRQTGFGIYGNGNVLHDNKASLNLAGGFFVGSGSSNKLRRNVAVANVFGFGVATGAEAEFERSSAIGNNDAGFLVLGTAGADDDARATIRKSNIYGNGDSPSNPPPNCGLVDASDVTTDARANYWGATTGPGPDTADDICSTGDSFPLFEPFSTKRIRR